MKKILFVIDSLGCAGAEKSLISLLNLIDYSRYEVDLQLFSYGGELESLLPPNVKLVSPLNYMKFTTLSFSKAILIGVINLKLKYLLTRIKFSLGLRIKKLSNNKEKARLFWEINKNCIDKSSKTYDIAIAYAQGVPTFYVADKIEAKKKFTWINTSYDLKGIEKEYQRKKYEKFDKIVCVSDSAKEIFENVYPEFKKKFEIIYDINNPTMIEQMSKIGEHLSKNNINLLTIGRLEYGKGYDIALEACKILKDKGINFKWYSLGKGPLKAEIEAKIKEFGLEEYFILLGVTSNPYGYIKSADIYVQTSRFEGFGLAIAEARILNVPVVTTEFDAVYNQMVQRKNGIVTQMDGKSVADGIMELIENEALRADIIEYLKNEKKGNLEEYNKFLKLIEEE